MSYLQVAPDGVWWHQGPLLVVRCWECESEGRGPLVVHDLRRRKPITASTTDELVRVALDLRLQLDDHQYFPWYESIVLSIAKERGLWDGMTLPQLPQIPESEEH